MKRALIVLAPTFTSWTTTDEQGVNKVVQHQVDALKSLGVTVDVISLDGRGAASATATQWLEDSVGRDIDHDDRVARLGLALDAALVSQDLVIAHDALFCGASVALGSALVASAQRNPRRSYLFWTHEIEKVGEDISGYGSIWGQRLAGSFGHLNELPCNVRAVFISDTRRREVLEQTGLRLPPAQSIVVHNGLDILVELGCSPTLSQILGERDVCRHDPILLVPARMSHDLSITLIEGVIERVRCRGRNPILLSTLDPRSPWPGDAQVRDRWRVRQDVVMVNDDRPDGVTASVLSDADVAALYRLADAVLFPSRREGFGMPLIEAALSRVPILTLEREFVRELRGPSTIQIVESAVDAAAVALLARLETEPWASSRSIRRDHDAPELLRRFFEMVLAESEAQTDDPGWACCSICTCS